MGSSLTALKGRYGALAYLGVKFNQHLWDQEAFVPWFNTLMQQVVAREVPLPHTAPLGPTFFRFGNKRIMMDATLTFPEGAALPGGLEDYTVGVRIVRAVPAQHRQQRAGGQLRNGANKVTL